jgi:hypothetical protein
MYNKIDIMAKKCIILLEEFHRKGEMLNDKAIYSRTTETETLERVS